MNFRDVLKELEDLSTERKEVDLSELSPGEIVQRLAEENARAILKIVSSSKKIVRLATWWAETLKGGGRIVLLGAGTSGRLAIMEAAEMFPTFGIARDRVVGLIAGGKDSVFASKEGAEDSERGGKRAVTRLGLGPKDLVIGLSASGRTPYVAGAILKAEELGARTALITTNPCSYVRIDAQLRICVDVGYELLPGSTRMKSATVQKVILNAVSLIGAVIMGKVERGRMVGMIPTSQKLKARAVRTLMEEFNLEEEDAERILEESGWDMKEAFRLAELHSTSSGRI
ncbi:MAG: N-acetylmuramic acid 6-phosphate etherase [Thermotogae bacterium]|nr:N-acetylmuramic acid 6-phosphate etherase [Thermotogota bacterium]